MHISHTKKNILISLLVLVLLPVALLVIIEFGTYRLEKLATDTLKEIAIGKKGKGYFVNFQDFDINWSSSKIKAIGITIIPNIQDNHNDWINGSVDTLSIQFKNIFSSAILGEVNLEHIRIIHPNIQYFWINQDKKVVTKKTGKHSPIPKLDVLSKRLSSIGISSIEIRDTEFNGYSVDKNNKHKHVFHSKQNFIIEGIEFNLDENNINKIINIKTFMFSCGPTFMRKGGSLYGYEFDSLVINNQNDFITLSKFKLHPLYSDKLFFDISGKQTDKMTLEIEELKGSGFKPEHLFNRDIIALNKISVDQLNYDIYRDKNYQEDTSKYKELPNKLIKRMKIDLQIDTININQSAISYREKSKDADNPGILRLSKINGSIHNINSTSNSPIKIDLKFNFLSKYPAYLKSSISLDTTSNWFLKADGHISKFPLVALNNFTHNNLGVLFQRGYSQKINFNLTLNNDIGRGNLDFFYNDLKLKITGKNDMKVSFVESLAGFAANNIVAYKNNWDDKRARHAPLYFKRVTYKSPIHYLIHTILSGAPTSVIGSYSQLPPEERKAYKHHKKATHQ
ncbi:AsmA family protein [Flammeovirga kamogawensis]|uniref:DUF748 domain-containing protein n=1 Tax=Flammeovirga kamogawensis TaxID=373891 RepID=A0ABX8GTM4_9BACT|nr:DUF748 domain-containing protein [Flammeovirga kamogawensis]MBB6460007.1 hypothetical protein [Flammeovirga kamogawensis]QWG06945.1 DUF748 domain-containing protein [Flammeovirga kamogawensis]